jgi:GDP-L-fucose synthase
MQRDARIYVAGSRTLIGRALVRQLLSTGHTSVIDDDADLQDRAAVERVFAAARPEYVFVAAGKTAGIVGNQRFPADLMTDNLLVAAHLIPAAWQHGVKKLLYLSSSCTYPKLAAQPLNVSSLWTGALEPTSAAYAVAKLAGITLCDAYRRQHGAGFISAIGADAYGPHDDFSPESSHVVGALMRRVHEARIAGAPSVDVWGSGTPRREFIYVDDLADACMFAMQQYDGLDPINLGTGTATSISDLAIMIRDVVGFQGELQFDVSKPDGMPFKGLDSSALRSLGWTPSVDVRNGLKRTYDWFLTVA